MAKRTRAPASRRLNITDDLKADIRHRFERTPESLSTMAADLGCSIQTVCNLATREGWVRYEAPPRDLSPAAKLLARAEKLAEQGAATLPLPPRSGGEGRPPELAEQAKADGVGGIDDEQEPPTPDPSPPRAARAGGGEEAVPSAQDNASPPAGALPDVTETAEQMHRELHELLAEVRAARVHMKREGAGRYALREISQTIATLSAVLRRLHPILRPAPASIEPESAYDDMPADLDAFREALARKIEAFMESRGDEADAFEVDADGDGEARS